MFCRITYLILCVEYHCGKDWKKGDPKNGDIFTHGHPNLWDVSLITDMKGLFFEEDEEDEEDDPDDDETTSNTAMVSMLWKTICINDAAVPFPFLLVLNKKRYESTMLAKKEVVVAYRVN